mgnify:CR=1 FL=1
MSIDKVEISLFKIDSSWHESLEEKAEISWLGERVNLRIQCPNCNTSAQILFSFEDLKKAWEAVRK